MAARDGGYGAFAEYIENKSADGRRWNADESTERGMKASERRTTDRLSGQFIRA